MISIRTALVLAAFVAMGLTSAAEHLARTAGAEAAPVGVIDPLEAMPGKVLRLTEKTPAAPTGPGLLPWI